MCSDASVDIVADLLGAIKSDARPENTRQHPVRGEEAGSFLRGHQSQHVCRKRHRRGWRPKQELCQLIQRWGLGWRILQQPLAKAMGAIMAWVEPCTQRSH